MNRKLRAALLRQPLSEVGFSKFRLYREEGKWHFKGSLTHANIKSDM